MPAGADSTPENVKFFAVLVGLSHKASSAVENLTCAAWRLTILLGAVPFFGAVFSS